MVENIELIEQINENSEKYISSPKLDGENARLLKTYLADDAGEKIANNVFCNAYKGIKYFVNPDCHSDDRSLSKILAVGRVQSGKTSYFISSIALAFDNGYDLVFLVGGTKNTLRDQNYERVDEYFKNNPNIKVYDINKVDCETVLNKISFGYKVILVVLKNASQNANLGKAFQIANECSNIPSLVVDDEGDEYTPGAPKLINKTNRIGATHDMITKIIYTFSVCTFLSVTATPQANFLISTIDSISPDFCVLVEPGDEYTGGNSFHDTLDNPHVTAILDTDDFKDSIPDSFMRALYFFIFAVCFKRSVEDLSRYSMLVHPSSLTKIQGIVIEKINDRLSTIIKTLKNKGDIAYNDTFSHIISNIDEYYRMNPGTNIKINPTAIEDQLPIVLDELSTYEFNISSSGREDIEREKNENKLYKIYVGGNMLGRGLTIKNLIVTYMYRDSKVQAIDTLYQRARWLGYKASYFDVCKVYMTDQLKEKFITTVDSENDMWDSLSKFLSLENSIKNFPRRFQLNDESGKLILTRKTVSKTVQLERVNPGFTYDKSIWFSKDDRIKNKELYINYRKKHINDSYEQCFSTNDYQTHLIIKTTFSQFYKEFLNDYILPKGSKFGKIGFQKIKEQIDDDKLDDDMIVMIMRYKTNEYRSIVGSGALVIKELPQSYNESTKYPGDKNLPNFENTMYFQIHLVYTDDNQKDNYVPLLCFNNPLSKKLIRYVTGDNTYDSI